MKYFQLGQQVIWETCLNLRHQLILEWIYYTRCPGRGSLPHLPKIALVFNAYKIACLRIRGAHIFVRFRALNLFWQLNLLVLTFLITCFEELQFPLVNDRRFGWLRGAVCIFSAWPLLFFGLIQVLGKVCRCLHNRGPLLITARYCLPNSTANQPTIISLIGSQEGAGLSEIDLEACMSHFLCHFLHLFGYEENKNKMLTVHKL